MEPSELSWWCPKNPNISVRNDIASVGLKWQSLMATFSCEKMIKGCIRFYSAPVRVRSIVIHPSVCVSVWPRLTPCQHISGTAGPIGTKFCVQIPCGHGSVVLRRHYTTLCTSGFMDDVTFSRNGRDAETQRLHRGATAGVAIPGRSLMFMNACQSGDPRFLPCDCM